MRSLRNGGRTLGLRGRMRGLRRRRQTFGLRRRMLLGRTLGRAFRRMLFTRTFARMLLLGGMFRRTLLLGRTFCRMFRRSLSPMRRRDAAAAELGRTRRRRYGRMTVILRSP